MKINIAGKLKAKRKALNLSIKEVVSKLHLYDIVVSEKTIYGWESGHRQPDADILIILCKIYNINSFSEFCDFSLDGKPTSLNSSFDFTNEEMQVTIAYRSANLKDKNTVRSALALPQLEQPSTEVTATTSKHKTAV